MKLTFRNGIAGLSAIIFVSIASANASAQQDTHKSILKNAPVVVLASDAHLFQDEVQDTPQPENNSIENSARQELPDWPVKSIREINIDPRDLSGDIPEDQSADVYANAPHVVPGGGPVNVVHWVAPNIRYQPLYFEDVALERYGQVDWGRFQYIKSSARMFGSALLLPYNMLVDNPNRCDYPLGFDRPGNCVPQTYSRMVHPRKPCR